MKTSIYIFRLALLLVLSSSVLASSDNDLLDNIPMGVHPGYVVDGNMVRTHNGYVPLPPDWDYVNYPIVINQSRPSKEK